MTKPRDDASSPTFGEMLEEAMNLGTGLGVALLPVLALAVPAIVLFVLLPAILLLALAVPLAAIGAVIALPPYLLARRLRRRRRRTPSSPARLAHSSPRSVSRLPGASRTLQR